ncbi:hypothetical protein LC085_21195 [Bacillus tianshenii]|uniref:hypothetical protein n=1 Tax=Sutcliffiella tianshenii TaxID=1463404 RepID=UPI001CD4B88A|nr:hypothetical protein [Bacillus tianshenii]MCA1322398.1 hypothetical protein [Bacillus tianshenii]
MRKYISFSTLGIITMIVALNVHITLVQAELENPWSKYPDNSQMQFAHVDEFYNNLDAKQYVEFKNAKLNIRETVYWKDVNKVFSKVDEYGAARVGGEGTHPNRQVYVFATVSQDGKMKTAVFDAETGYLSAATSE